MVGEQEEGVLDRPFLSRQHLTFPRDKFHLVSRQKNRRITRMAGAIGNYAFAVIGRPAVKPRKLAFVDRESGEW